MAKIRSVMLTALHTVFGAVWRLLGFSAYTSPAEAFRRFAVLTALLAVCGLLAAQSGPVAVDAQSAAVAGIVAWPSPTPTGYWLFDTDGRIYAFGGAMHFGDNISFPSPTPSGLVGMATSPNPSPTGYWLVDAGGRVLNFGGAPHLGDNFSQPDPSPDGFVGMVAMPNPTPTGYWLVDMPGRVLAFGAAQHVGDNLSHPSPSPGGIVGMAPVPDPTPTGYWLLDQAGRVLSFGSAPYAGDNTTIENPSQSPFVGIAARPAPSPVGYWLLDRVGRVLSFGLQKTNFGDNTTTPDPSSSDFVGIAATPTGNGYWLLDAAGRVQGFGDAPFLGDLTGSYIFSGFFQPVDNDALNVVRAGAAIPVKFSLNGDHGLQIFAPDYPTSQGISCSTTDPLVSIEVTVSAGGSSLSYDPVADQYTYVWKTNRAWAGTCRQLVVRLNDGRIHVAEFQFK